VLSETQAAMRLLAVKSGMAFTYKGATTEVPRVGSTARQSADIVIAFTTPAKTNYPLAGANAGQGGYSGGWRSTSNGTTTTYSAGINKGFLVIDTPDMMARFKAGFGTGTRRGNLLLHELGHVMGLSHVSNARLLMNPSLSAATPNGYAAGDLAGLARVGRKAGCIPGW
jgi:predicted Zn-dependent protease